MNRTLLAAALLLVCFASALAESGKTKAKEIPVVQRSERLAKALGGFNRGDPTTPIGNRAFPITGAGAREPAAANAGKRLCKKGRS